MNGDDNEYMRHGTYPMYNIIIKSMMNSGCYKTHSRNIMEDRRMAIRMGNIIDFLYSNINRANTKALRWRV